jgi:UDP-2,3-diacylglucosamine pyrophosphatase LpxH
MAQFNFPRHDEVHVVSDLHMGGKRGFQILRETARLAGFIRWVSQQNPGGTVALVLNGDVFDSLAEDFEGYMAAAEAVTMLDRIMDDDQFAPVWAALADFVKKPGRTLVLVIGNHDIEIAFPPVQRRILERLASDDLAARARIEFSTVGAGYSCVVGGSRVFCTHGNEVDGWNFVKYEDLSKVARRLNAGRALDPAEWQPNAGTKMVKDVMNGVKRKYAWIDLLKPEMQAAVGVLMVLAPDQLPSLNRLLPIIGKNVSGSMEYNHRLSVDAAVAPGVAAAPPAAADQLLGANVREAMNSGARPAASSGHDMLLDIEMNPDQAPVAATANDRLGTGQLIFDRMTGWITGVGKDEALRRALKDWLADDKSYDPAYEDETYTALTKTVGNEVDMIVAGHTHLERAINMGGGRWYYNTGTWIRLLQFTSAHLANTQAFKPVYDVLTNGTMDAIDKASFVDVPFVLDRTTALSIRANGGTARGELVHVEGDGTKLTVVA